MRLKVLGSAAGGGFPQWNCACPNCSRLRQGTLKGRARTQTQVAVSATPGSWFLLNASPDLRQQITLDRDLAPSSLRGSPIHSIILTSADTDSVMGLLHLREFQPLRIFATESVQRILNEENSLFRVLKRSDPPVQWGKLQLGEPALIGGGPQGNSEIRCRAISLPGHFPDYVSEQLRAALREDEAVIGLYLTQGDTNFFFAPTLPALNDETKCAVGKSSIAMLDGTFWTDDELIQIRGSGKTATEIGHIPLSGSDGMLQQMKSFQSTRRILVHLNNTNPVLDEESDAYRTLKEAGWEVAHDGMEIAL
jgi:pyrroloquinoline quinone biosynthesis protein B